MQIGLLKTLCSLCVEREPEVCITVRKLAMVSTMAVFKDIVPGYVPTLHGGVSVSVFRVQNTNIIICFVVKFTI